MARVLPCSPSRPCSLSAGCAPLPAPTCSQAAGGSVSFLPPPRPSLPRPLLLKSPHGALFPEMRAVTVSLTERGWCAARPSAGSSAPREGGCRPRSPSVSLARATAGSGVFPVVPRPTVGSSHTEEQFSQMRPLTSPEQRGPGRNRVSAAQPGVFFQWKTSLGDALASCPGPSFLPGQQCGPAGGGWQSSVCL